MKTDERLDFAKGKGSLCFSRESVGRMLEKKENEMLEFATFYANYNASFIFIKPVEGEKEESVKECYDIWKRDKEGEE